MNFYIKCTSKYQFESQRILVSNTNRGQRSPVSIAKAISMNFSRKKKKKNSTTAISHHGSRSRRPPSKNFYSSRPNCGRSQPERLSPPLKSPHDRKTINHVLARRSTSFTIRIPDPRLL